MESILDKNRFGLPADFFGNDDQVDIKKFKKPEFCEWRWINPIDCLDLVVPFKRTLYKKVLKNFRNLYQE